MRYFLLVCLVCGVGWAYGQDEQDITAYIPTDNITKQKNQRKKNDPYTRKTDVIIKNAKNDILYGNPCLNEETHRMGFEYAIQTKGMPGSLSGFKMFWNNLGVYTKLIFTKSPFWKTTLNNRVKDCRERTGDFVG